MIQLITIKNNKAEIQEKFQFTDQKNTVVRVVEFGGESYRTEVDCSSFTEEELTAPREVFERAYLQSTVEPGYPESNNGSVNIVDLFSGIGGLTLGVTEACRASGREVDVKYANDQNKYCINVYEDNFDPVTTDVEKIGEILDGSLGDPPTKNEKALKKKLGDIDLCVAGPPCQGHSDLNNHTRRDDPRNHLYTRVARFAKIFEPDHLIIENVPTIIHDKKEVLDIATESLNEIYPFVDSDRMELEKLGVPQKRKRHVLLASKENSIPELREIQDKFAIVSNRSVSWGIQDLENLEVTSGNGQIFDSKTSHNSDNVNRIQYLFENDKYDLPDELRPDCHKTKEHSYDSVYGRLYPDKPAQTITTGFTSPGQGRYIHPNKKRTITPHEAARLQYFPDFFDFSSAPNRTQLAKMIGNAVPMRLTYYLTLHLLGLKEANE